MSDHVTPKPADFMQLMLEAPALPNDWETTGFWLFYAEQLAQFMADHHGRISLDEAAMLLCIGVMMIQMAEREQGASAEAGRWPHGQRGTA